MALSPVGPPSTPALPSTPPARPARPVPGAEERGDRVTLSFDPKNGVTGYGGTDRYGHSFYLAVQEDGSQGRFGVTQDGQGKTYDRFDRQGTPQSRSETRKLVDAEGRPAESTLRTDVASGEKNTEIQGTDRFEHAYRETIRPDGRRTREGLTQDGKGRTQDTFQGNQALTSRETRSEGPTTTTVTRNLRDNSSSTYVEHHEGTTTTETWTDASSQRTRRQFSLDGKPAVEDRTVGDHSESRRLEVGGREVLDTDTLRYGQDRAVTRTTLRPEDGSQVETYLYTGGGQVEERAQTVRTQDRWGNQVATRHSEMPRENRVSDGTEVRFGNGDTQSNTVTVSEQGRREESRQQIGGRTYESTRTQSQHQGATVEQSVDKVNGETVRDSHSAVESQALSHNLPGWAWFGSHNGQNLMNRLEDKNADDVSSTRKVESWTGAETGEQTVDTFSNAKRKESLSMLKSGESPALYVYSQPGQSAERPDSQVFFQGSKDKVVTRNSDVNGWHIANISSDLSSQEAAKEGILPQRSVGTRKEKDGASASELKAEASALEAPLPDLKGSKFSVQSFQESGTYADFQPHKARNLVARSDENETFAYFRDPKEGSEASLLVKGDGTRTYRRREAGGEWVNATSLDESMQIRLDRLAAPTGHEEHSSVAHSLAAGAGNAAAAAELGGSAVKKLGGSHELVKQLDKAGLAGDAVAALGNDVAMVQAAAHGDVGHTLEAGAHATQDVARAAMTAEHLASHGVIRASAAWAGTASKVMGIGGGVLELGIAAHEFAHGHAVAGSCSVANAAGTGLILAGMGPAGWTVVGAASLGKAAWQFNEDTKIADFALDDRRSK